MSAYTFEQIIAAYTATRGEIDVIAERHKEELRPFTEKLEKLNAWLLGQLNAQKLQNAKTEFGTAYKVERMVIKQPDAEAFETFVKENHAYELVKLAPVTAAIKSYADEHHGALPPGLAAEFIVSVNVRRA